MRHKPSSVEALRHFRAAQVEGLAGNVEEYFFHLALDEMLSNAIRHGASTPLSTGASSRGPESPVGDGEEDHPDGALLKAGCYYRCPGRRLRICRGEGAGPPEPGADVLPRREGRVDSEHAGEGEMRRGGSRSAAVVDYYYDLFPS